MVDHQNGEPRMFRYIGRGLSVLLIVRDTARAAAGRREFAAHRPRPRLGRDGGVGIYIGVSIAFGYLVGNVFDMRVVVFGLVSLGLTFFGLRTILGKA